MLFIRYQAARWNTILNTQETLLVPVGHVLSGLGVCLSEGVRLGLSGLGTGIFLNLVVLTPTTTHHLGQHTSSPLVPCNNLLISSSVQRCMGRGSRSLLSF